MSPRDRSRRQAIARSMASAIAHRGPDDEGTWLDDEHGIALASRRLAIQDLSAHGHQPMASHSGRCVIAYNGEIYNTAQLRRELAAAGAVSTWRGHSDTEVLLEACEHWGVAAALRRCHGMFAFALWDRARRTLTLARDRFGEKPVYYGRHGATLLFGSELKALAAHPDFERRLDTRAVGAYLRRGFVAGPATIYAGIRKLPPATLIECPLDRPGGPGWQAPRSYWSALETALAARSRPYASADEAREAVAGAIAASVQSCLVADVPVGAFLSGGIDSSLVVACMQQAASQPARTFTISYEDARYDESAHAELVARHLGTQHETHLVTPTEIEHAIPALPTIYDEPFADVSQLPTYLVATAARRRVTVALTGDGGDELFGGYPRYFDGQRAWRQIERLPRPLRGTLAGALSSLSPGSWNAALDMLRRLPGMARMDGVNGSRMHRLAHALRSPDARTMYAGLMNRDAALSAAPRDDDDGAAMDGAGWDAGLALPEAMMLADTLDVLVDDFLVKVDRAAMAVSLETRSPLLSVSVFEAAWRLPLEQRVGTASGKQILRDLLEHHVPRSITERPKQGFGIPLGRWLTGPLRDWAEALLDAGTLAAGGLVDPVRLRRQWGEHLAGTHDHERSLWTVLMLQAWLQGDAR